MDRPADSRDTVAAARAQVRPRRMDMLDRLVDSRVSLVLGPLQVPPVDRLRVALIRLAAAGLHTRVGLVLGEDESWIPLGAGIANHTDDMIRTAPDSVTDLRRWIEDSWVPGLPLQFAVTSDRIAFVADHRLMDGTLAVVLIPTLFQLAKGGPVPSTLRSETPRPLASALAHTYLKNPGTALRLVRHLRQHKTPPLPEPHPITAPIGPAAPTPGPPQITHLVRQLPLGVVEQVRQWDADRVGMSAALLLLTAQALRAAGVSVAPQGILVVNLRRYLPTRSPTLGNFITGIKVPLEGPLSDPTILGQRIGQSLDVGRPLMGTAITVAKGRLLDFTDRRAAAGPADPAPTAPAAPVGPANVSFSFSGRWRLVEALPWHVAPEERYVEPLGDAVGPDGIGFLACSVDRRLRLGASFHGDRYDAGAVGAAMEAVGSRTSELLAALDARG